MGECENGDGDMTAAVTPRIVSAHEWEAAPGKLLVTESN